MSKANIQAIDIAEHYDVVADLMRCLHENEERLFVYRAPWPVIKENYMAHMIARQREDQGLCLVAYVDGKVAGVCFGWIVVPGDDNLDQMNLSGYVSDAFVYEQYRQQGIYKTLHQAMEKYFLSKNVDRVSVFTLVNNAPMNAYLNKAAYQPVHTQYQKWFKSAEDKR